MNFDDLFDNHIGEFGRFQKTILLYTMWAMMMFGIAIYESVFTTITPDFWYLKEGENLTQIDIFNRTRCCDCFESNTVVEPHALPTTFQWVYDDSIYSRNIVTQFDLVCSREWLVATSKSIFMIGIAFGAVTSGLLSDMYGRRRVFICTALLPIISRIVCAFSPTFAIYCTMRFITGACVISGMCVGYTLATEFCGTRSRLWVGGIAPLAFVGGSLTCTCVSYFIRDRVMLELMLTLVYLPALSYFWIVPESPRWLYSKQRIKEANILLRKVARWNRTQLPETISIDAVDEKTTFAASMRAICSSWKLIHCTAVLYLTWWTVSLVFYGVVFNMGKFAGDLYTNTLISVLMEIPSYSFMPLIVKTPLGRCGTISVGILLASVALFATAPLGTSQIVTYLSVFGKTTVLLSFCSLYPFTSELFPTPVRSLGFGSSSMMARIGSLIAPFLMLIGTNDALKVFGGICLITGLAILTLPETRGEPLPQSVADLDNRPSVCVTVARKLCRLSGTKSQSNGKIRVESDSDEDVNLFEI